VTVVGRLSKECCLTIDGGHVCNVAGPEDPDVWSAALQYTSLF